MRHRPVARVIAGTVALAALGLPAPAASRSAPDLVPGVSSKTIRIGYHASFTGAVQLPSESIDRAARVYWRWRQEKHRPIRGRHVEVVMKNDNYNPSQAVAVCKEMVEQDHVFMLSGVLQPSGVDQLQACARYAASVGVPYVSLGSTRILLGRLRNYFAMTLTWPKQARRLADYLVTDLGARKENNGMVRHHSPNYEDTHTAFVSAMQRKGAALDYDRTASRNATSQEAQIVVQEMKAAGIDNVHVLTTPIFFLQLLQAARSQDYRPLWTGISPMTFSDELPDIGCRNGTIGGARFLAQVPAFDDRDAFDRRHDRAMREIYSEGGDGITWMGWAGSKATAKLLRRPGRHLTRKRFIRSAERTRRIRTRILPPFGFTRRDHLGGRSTHVLRAGCRDRRWHTIRRFVRDF